jgi:hypothetical protein
LKPGRDAWWGGVSSVAEYQRHAGTMVDISSARTSLPARQISGLEIESKASANEKTTFLRNLK